MSFPASQSPCCSHPLSVAPPCSLAQKHFLAASFSRTPAGILLPPCAEAPWQPSPSPSTSQPTPAPMVMRFLSQVRARGVDTQAGVRACLCPGRAGGRSSRRQWRSQPVLQGAPPTKFSTISPARVSWTPSELPWSKREESPMVDLPYSLSACSSPGPAIPPGRPNPRRPCSCLRGRQHRRGIGSDLHSCVRARTGVLARPLPWMRPFPAPRRSAAGRPLLSPPQRRCRLPARPCRVHRCPMPRCAALAAAAHCPYVLPLSCLRAVRQNAQQQHPGV
jgi:hypothetical protein